MDESLETLPLLDYMMNLKTVFRTLGNIQSDERDWVWNVQCRLIFEEFLWTLDPYIKKDLL